MQFKPRGILGVGTFVVAASLILVSCKEKESGPPPSRFQAVTQKKSKSSAKRVQDAEKKFCEEVFPASGPGAKKHTPLASRALPGAKVVKESAPGKIRWVNFWATWCGPCVDEIPLLKQWEATLQKDGIDVGVELWSADDDQEALARWLKSEQAKNTDARWLAEASMLRAMESFGVDKNSPIPLHALIDKNDQVRCVRVGSVHARDYPAVKALLSSYD